MGNLAAAAGRNDHGAPPSAFGAISFGTHLARIGHSVSGVRKFGNGQGEHVVVIGCIAT